MKHAKFLRNAAVISLGGLLAKGIGALYRIPLTGLLGSYGMGLYQMAYPLFCVLLTFSSAGIPSAMARLVAREDRVHYTESAVRLFAGLGAGGSLVMILLAPFLSGLQGDGALRSCYLALSPSVFFVALIAVFRGYFQGRGNMIPTALSEITEQIVKAAAGLLLAGMAAEASSRASFALFAVTLSEFAALLYLFARYKRENRDPMLYKRGSGRSVFKAALPVMAATSLLPLSRMADSVIAVRLLARHTARAVALYGLFSGAAVSLCALPATLCYGLVAATVPAVSKGISRGDGSAGRQRALYALLLTLLLSLPFAVLLFLFAGPITEFLYPALSAADRQTLAGLVKISSLFSVFLSGTDTLAASLTGMGRAKYAALSMAVAIAVKHTLQFFLINESLGVTGAALSESACFLIAFCADLLYTVKKPFGKKREKTHDHGDRIGNGCGRLDAERNESAEIGGRSVVAHAADPLRTDLERRKYPL